MVVGVAMATCGMGILAFSSHAGFFILGIFVFSVGEMTTHPKFISYNGLIAPDDKKALYMGYMFLYGVLGSSIGGFVGGYGYEHFVKERNDPQTLWLLFSAIGAATIVGLLLFDRFVAPAKVSASAART
jgi:MFS family permease